VHFSCSRGIWHTRLCSGLFLLLPTRRTPSPTKATSNSLWASPPCPALRFQRSFTTAVSPHLHSTLKSYPGLPHLFSPTVSLLRACPLKASPRLPSSLCTEDSFPPGRGGACSTLRGHVQPMFSMTAFKAQLELACNLPALIFTLCRGLLSSLGCADS